MDSSQDLAQREKAGRLINYLLRLAQLQTRQIRDIANYQRSLWLSEIPAHKECFARVWGDGDNVDSDIWLEVQNRQEPQLPDVPELCLDWVDHDLLIKKADIPELMPEIVRQIRNPAWQNDNDEPEFVDRVEHLAEYPEVHKAWERFIDKAWFPWVAQHNDWESIHRVYSSLFAMHQEQLRLGEEYELVVGLGLLTWRTPNSQHIRRHLVVADAVLEFEARLSKFTIRSSPDGAKLRTELDMLDIDSQPVEAEKAAVGILSDASDDPWNRSIVAAAIRELAHSISPETIYEDTVESKCDRATEKPVVEFAPAVILRKRSAKGLVDILTKMKALIESGGGIPSEFRDITEIRIDHDGDKPVVPDPEDVDPDPEVYFPKPSNDEQRRIVEKITMANGVLVQGPPGTGKSHTIANLVCHLLATGHRILITAKTPRALQVLMGRYDKNDGVGLIPEEIRSLCVSLLGSGLDERRSLEASVSGILREYEAWSDSKATARLEALEGDIHDLREEKARIDRRLRDIRESETHRQSVASGAYAGTARQIALAINRDREAFNWFPDVVPLEGDCPVNEHHMFDIIENLRQFDPQRRAELQLFIPQELPSSETVQELISTEQQSIKNEHLAESGADPQTASIIAQMDDVQIKEVLEALATYREKWRYLAGRTESWLPQAIHDIINGAATSWDRLNESTRQGLESVSRLISVADTVNLEVRTDVGLNKLIADVDELRTHIEKGGKLGWWFFRSKVVRQRKYILKSVYLNHAKCEKLADFQAAADVLRVREVFDRMWRAWARYGKRTEGPFTLQADLLRSCCEALDVALSLHPIIVQFESHFKNSTLIQEPDWTNVSDIEQVGASCRLALSRHARIRASDRLQSVELRLSAAVARDDAHPISDELLATIRDRDIRRWCDAAEKMQILQSEQLSLSRLDEEMDCLREMLPLLAAEISDTCDDPAWEARIKNIRRAWSWAQAARWLDSYVSHEDTTSLTIRSKQIDNDLGTLVAKIASLRAWQFCFGRLTEDHRRHMEMWQQSMRRLGKGTGKHAPRHRREAQGHLSECRGAVPAWVMPLHRIWDTVDVAPAIFDVIIVDEASQCGFEALPLFYLGKKILIVGDDKQISPEEGFVDKAAVFQLMKQFLYDFEFADAFHRDVSLFHHGKRLYGTSRIVLREHFRCMPEIIRFSNDLCYRDTPLIPLRQYGQDRLQPLIRKFVEEGYREGSDSRAINRPEAKAIVTQIADICHSQEYNEKTIGVVVLQGYAQGALIENMLLEELGAEEMERRRLICGNPYSFQGDERDVMFLSMVAAPNMRIGALAKDADTRRFNVAASRAKDQMWLYHSVRREDLSASCLRRQLLEFYDNVRAREVAGIDVDELERRAMQDERSIIKPPQPFDSWFEVDVALELLRRKFHIIPQFEIAGKRIDLVVEGGATRLAVECDGDNWHGIDKYEDDVQRQRQLERCGWEFFRVRGSVFYADCKRALDLLWRMLEERGIKPEWPVQETAREEEDLEPEEAESFTEPDGQLSFVSVAPVNHAEPHRRVDSVTSGEIQKAIVSALQKCPNRSCTIHSLTSRVLKELRVLTRGNPRLEFEKRIMRSVGVLERKQFVESYRAKNRRIRLL